MTLLITTISSLFNIIQVLDSFINVFKFMNKFKSENTFSNESLNEDDYEILTENDYEILTENDYEIEHDTFLNTGISDKKEYSVPKEENHIIGSLNEYMYINNVHYTQSVFDKILLEGSYSEKKVENLRDVICIIRSGFNKDLSINFDSGCWVIKDNKIVWGLKIICPSTQANNFRNFVVGTQSSPKRMLELAILFEENIESIMTYEWSDFVKRSIHKKHILFPDKNGNACLTIIGTYVCWK